MKVWRPKGWKQSEYFQSNVLHFISHLAFLSGVLFCEVGSNLSASWRKVIWLYLEQISGRFNDYPDNTLHRDIFGHTLIPKCESVRESLTAALHVWSFFLPLSLHAYSTASFPVFICLPLVSWQLWGGVLFGKRSHGCRSHPFRLTSLHSWTDRAMMKGIEEDVAGVARQHMRINGLSTLTSSFMQLHVTHFSPFI